MRPEDVKNTMKAGIFVGIALCLVVMVSLMLNKEKSLFDSVTSLYTKVKNAQGLKQGSAVKLQGIKIGTVKSIKFQGLHEIIIELEIIKKHLKWIKKDSFLSFKTQGVLGDKFLEINGGTKDSEFARPKDYLSAENATEMKDFILKGENILVSANNVLRGIDQLLQEINDQGNIAKTLANFSATSAKLNDLFSKKVINNFSKTVENMATLSSRITEGPGTAHSFIYDNSVYHDLQALLGGAQRNKVLRYFIRESINKSEKIKK